MGLPPPGYGPFGRRAFRAALIGCVVVAVAGLTMILWGGEAARSVGIAFVVLGAVGLGTAGAGLLAERLLGRRPPP